MSIASWKKEFISKKGSTLDGIIKKLEGLRTESLEKHDCHWFHNEVAQMFLMDGKTEYMYHSGHMCSLCPKRELAGCPQCKVTARERYILSHVSLNVRLHNALIRDGNPEPMIEYLKETVQ